MGAKIFDAQISCDAVPDELHITTAAGVGDDIVKVIWPITLCSSFDTSRK
jgi:hypothetical protein